MYVCFIYSYIKQRVRRPPFPSPPLTLMIKKWATCMEGTLTEKSQDIESVYGFALI